MRDRNRVKRPVRALRRAWARDSCSSEQQGQLNPTSVTEGLFSAYQTGTAGLSRLQRGQAQTLGSCWSGGFPWTPALSPGGQLGRDPVPPCGAQSRVLLGSHL